MASGLIRPFLHGSWLQLTDRDIKTSHATPSVATGHIIMLCIIITSGQSNLTRGQSNLTRGCTIPEHVLLECLQAETVSFSNSVNIERLAPHQCLCVLF